MNIEEIYMDANEYQGQHLEIEWIYGTRNDNINRNVSDCMAIIEFVCSSDGGKSQSEISRETGIPYSSVARYVRKEKFETMSYERVLSYRKTIETPGFESIYYNLIGKSDPIKIDGTTKLKVNMSKHSLLKSVGTWMGCIVEYKNSEKRLWVTSVDWKWRQMYYPKNVGIISEDWKSIGYFDPGNGNIVYIVMDGI